jgi:DNA-binding MarR family transcriptional regulator
MSQPTLFDQPRARRSDPETSHKAAKSLKPARLRDQIVAAIYAHGGLTIKEIAKLIDREQVTVSPSIKPLRRAGVLRDSGRRRRNEGTGKEAIVWEIGKEPDPPAEITTSLIEEIKAAAKEAIARTVPTDERGYLTDWAYDQIIRTTIRIVRPLDPA